MKLKNLSVSLWLGLGLLAPTLALACDACYEDQMAATYDHAVIEKAAAQQRVVVFCDVAGDVKPERLREVAAKVPGLDPASVRTSTDPAALSFALDPKVLSADGALTRISTALNGKARVTLIRTVDPAAH